METYVVRVWLPDRPGALGQVASRIGAVRGDVTGIEIMETGAGVAVDDLTVCLPAADLADLLVAEIGEVDGVDVEDIRRVDGPDRDSGLEALDAAALLAETAGGGDPFEALARLLADLLRADWVAVSTSAPVRVRASVGEAPSVAWLSAYVEGVRHLGEHGPAAPADLAWAALPTSGHVVALGRAAHPLRWRERRQISALARVADALARATAEPMSAGIDPAA